ncbi:mechanosensitive ion channel family protein [Alsobacter sp. SYSU BS001988]
MSDPVRPTRRLAGFAALALASLLLAAAPWASALAASSPSSSALVPFSLNSGKKDGDAKAVPPDDPAKVPDFVSRLDDRQARALLLDTLSGKPKGEEARDRDTVSDIFGSVLAAARQYAARIVTVAQAWPQLLTLDERLTDYLGTTRPGLVALLGWIALSFLAAGAVEYLVRLLFERLLARRRRLRGLPAPPQTLRHGGRLGVRCVGLASFMAVSSGLILAAPHAMSSVQQDFALSIAAGALLVRLADTLAYLCIAYLVPPSERAHRRVPRNAVRLAVVSTHATIIMGALILTDLRGAGVAFEARLIVGLALWCVLGLCVFAGLGRLKAITAEPSLDGPLAREGVIFRWLRLHWYGLARAVVGAVWLFTVLAALEAGPMAFEAGVLSLFVVAYTPAAVRLLTLVLRRSFARQRGHDEKSDPPWITSIVRCARILATVAALYGLGRVWGLDVFAYASDRLGESVARMVIDVAIILLLAYVVWEIIRAIIRSESAGDPVDPDEPEISFEEGSMKPQTRMQTFLPLVEKFLFVLVLIVAGMMILKTLGVDTGPLLAGAGIIGIAIGFGAQTLVKDIVSGIFFLFDDAFRLGEYVEIDQTRGTVEGISIRSLRIRHHRGAVHTVPFGTIQRLTNYSRDWIILKLEFLLAFETDLKKVKKIVKDIGKELMEDEEYGQHFLEPVKSQGVRRMEQIGMVIGVKFMAKPGEQFILRREVYQRVRDAFEKNGIAFARPQVVVQVPNAKMSPEESEAIAAAAAEAADMPPPPPQELKQGGGAKKAS